MKWAKVRDKCLKLLHVQFCKGFCGALQLINCCLRAHTLLNTPSLPAWVANHSTSLANTHSMGDKLNEVGQKIY